MIIYMVSRCIWESLNKKIDNHCNRSEQFIGEMTIRNLWSII